MQNHFVWALLLAIIYGLVSFTNLAVCLDLDSYNYLGLGGYGHNDHHDYSHDDHHYSHVTHGSHGSHHYGGHNYHSHGGGGGYGKNTHLHVKSIVTSANTTALCLLHGGTCASSCFSHYGHGGYGGSSQHIFCNATFACCFSGTSSLTDTHDFTIVKKVIKIPGGYGPHRHRGHSHHRGFGHHGNLGHHGFGHSFHGIGSHLHLRKRKKK